MVWYSFFGSQWSIYSSKKHSYTPNPPTLKMILTLSRDIPIFTPKPSAFIWSLLPYLLLYLLLYLLPYLLLYLFLPFSYLFLTNFLSFFSLSSFLKFSQRSINRSENHLPPSSPWKNDISILPQYSNIYCTPHALFLFLFSCREN